MYSGQLDVIVAAPLTERFLLTVNWTGAAEFRKAPRFHWKVQPQDSEVAGYVKQVREFYQVRRVGGVETTSRTSPDVCFCVSGDHQRGRAHSALRPTRSLL